MKGQTLSTKNKSVSGKRFNAILSIFIAVQNQHSRSKRSQSFKIKKSRFRFTESFEIYKVVRNTHDHPTFT